MILVYCFLLLTLQLLQRASGFWHSLLSPSGSDALWLKLAAAPWQLGKTNEPSSPYQRWEPFPNRLLQRSALEKSSVWKLAPRAIFAARPRLPFTQGSCSTKQMLSRAGLLSEAGQPFDMMKLYWRELLAHREVSMHTIPSQGQSTTEQEQKRILASKNGPVKEMASRL